MSNQVVALDLGGGTLKAAKATPDPNAELFMLQNYIGMLSDVSKTCIGDELIEQERHRAKLRSIRPIERGYCVNWNVETDIWSHLFGKKMLNTNPKQTHLITTSPLFSPRVVNEMMDQVVFEEFGFDGYTRVNCAEMCVRSYNDEIMNQVPSSISTQQRLFQNSSCQLVVDSGFSFTHIIPIFDGKVYHKAVKRVNVGGKLLTNYLKEILSFRQWNVQDESVVINELKEALCYCSTDFTAEMRKYHHQRSARKQWILPDFVHHFKGRLRDENEGIRAGDDEQALEMGLEMISVPEVLFNPSDIGLNQAGIPEAIFQAVSSCPREIQPALYQNILLAGGNTKYPNFKTRLESELRPLVSDDFEINIHYPSDPILSSWKGASLFAQGGEYKEHLVTKKEYEEYGSNICFRRFLA